MNFCKPGDQNVAAKTDVKIVGYLYILYLL